MIRKLQIENYESHQKTVLNFGPGITVITGASDHGKSAIRRAMEWVCLNRPLGTDFISWGQNKATVTLDGITKSRSSKTHVYEVDGHKYKAFRAEVPAPVYDKLGISEYNFQRQHNAYFLINDSPGQVARTLNKVADLTLIDKTLAEGKSRLKAAKGKAIFTEEQRQKKLGELEKLEWSVEAYADVQKAEQLETHIKILTIRIETLSAAVSTTLLTQKKVNRYPDIDFDISLLIQTERRLDTTKMDILQRAVDSTRQTENLGLEDVPVDLKKLGAVLSRLDPTKVFNLTKNMEEFEECREKAAALENIALDLLSLMEVETQIDTSKQIVVTVENILRDKAIYDEINDRYIISKKHFEDELKRLGICPFCGGDT